MTNNQRVSLDFIIIGAQKAGTTSIYKYLEKHPQIYMPPEKEAPYFCVEERYKQGLESYFNVFFTKAPHDRIWGKSTPHYMCDMRVPARIARWMPDIKLIALLRNPIERAMSHYKMCVRRGRDRRTFDEAIEQLLEPSALKRSRELKWELENETDCYIVRGEYGRILDEYLKWFCRDHILVIYFDDLESDPVSLYRRICNFLEVDPDPLPKNLGKRYHVGGTLWKHPSLEKLREFELAKSMWHLVPNRQRRRIMHLYEQWNIKPDNENDMSISDKTKKHLVGIFKEDILALQRLFGRDLSHWLK